MLNANQLAALKADIAANNVQIVIGGVTIAIKDVPNTPDQNAEIANWYNLVASPDYWVWKSFVRDQDIYSSTTVDGTTWSWTIFINRSQGERDGWRQMVNMAGGLNPSLAAVRQGVADIFSGAGGAAQRTHLLTIGRRLSTNAEKLFAAATAGGVGQRGLAANPDTMTYEGALTGDNITSARNS